MPIELMKRQNRLFVELKGVFYNLSIEKGVIK